jgi:hypothetical protein
MNSSISILVFYILLFPSLTLFTKDLSKPIECKQLPKTVNSKKNSDSISPTLSFSNYTWYVKSGTATPGPNAWSEHNAFVDSLGRLHLKITYNSITKSWDCAEIWTTEALGFGAYEWFVEGPLDKLDKNIVLGLFNYPASPQVPDATNEIDIEYAKWGIETNKAGNFTVWPAYLLNGYTNQTYPFGISLNNNKSTQRFTWQPTSVAFESIYGWRNDNDSIIDSKIFKPKNPSIYIPQTAEPVHINLWLFKGLPPSDSLPVEIIINSFRKS